MAYVIELLPKEVNSPTFDNLQSSLGISAEEMDSFYAIGVRTDEDYSAERTAQILEAIRDDQSIEKVQL